MPSQVDDVRHVVPVDPVELVLEEAAHAGVLQPDAVHEPAGRLPDADALVAAARGRREPLGGDAAEPRDVEVSAELAPESAGARGEHHGVLHRDPGEAHRRARRIRHRQNTSSAGKTGPSVQTFLRPLVVPQLQARHAPKPQAILFSRLT